MAREIEHIAILTSTKPLRMRQMRAGRQVEVLDPRACLLLASKFELVIIGSSASDKFYTRIRASLPIGMMQRFRLYSESYFDDFDQNPLIGEIPAEKKNVGWRSILKENHIRYEMQKKVVEEGSAQRVQEFDWKHIEDFITDPRVTVIRSREQVLTEF